MKICEGFNDWISCVKCKDICTSRCPIEGDKSLDDIGRGLNTSRLSMEGRTSDTRDYGE